MKKFRHSVRSVLSLTLTLALLLAGPGSPPLPAGAQVIPSPVNVRLTSLGSSLQSISVTAVGTYLLTESGDRLTPGGDYSLRAGNGGVTVDGPNGFHRVLSQVTLSKKDTSADGVKLYNAYWGRTNNYLGNLIFLNDGGNLAVYNQVDMETYLYGVVAMEMGDSFPPEALKAQAVAARTFAYKRQNQVTDKPDTQSYIGYDPAFSKTRSAVDTTRGQVLVYNNQLIDAYYSASNGGWADRTDFVWSAYYPYYQFAWDQADRDNPKSPSGTLIFPRSGASSSLDSRLASFFDTPIRQALSALGLGSAAYTISGFSNLVTHTPPNSNYPADTPLHTKGDFTIELSVNGSPVSVTVTVALKDLFSATGKTAYRVFETRSDAGSWYLDDFGYGHGIGLSQRGAQQRANNGQSYTDILGFYFVDCAITSFDLSALTLPDWTGISTTRVNIRSGPSTSYGILAGVVAGDHFTVLQDGIPDTGNPSNPTWCNIRLESGTVGYVRSDYILLGLNPAMNITDFAYSAPGTLTTGVRYDLLVSPFPGNANEDYTFVSSNPAVATVDLWGVVTTHAEGTATITVSGAYGRYSKDIPIAVNDSLPTPLALTPNDNSGLGVGDRSGARALTGIAPGTPVAGLKANLTQSGGTLQVLDRSGNPIPDNAQPGTGATVRLYNGASLQDSATVIIYGDISGDGSISITDYVQMKAFLLGKITLDGPAAIAGNLKRSGNVSITDYVKLKAFLLGRESIAQN